MGRVFLYFFNSAWSASFLILAVLVLRLVLRKMPKQLFVPLWGIAALRLLISFGPSFRFSLTPSRAPLRLSPVGIPLAETGFETVDNALQPLLADSFARVSGSLSLGKLLSVLALVWLAGILAFMLYQLADFLNLRRLIASAEPGENGCLYSPYFSIPFVFGVRTPVICLPASADPENTSFFLAHEKMHIVQKDTLKKLLAGLLLALFWFYPPAWLCYFLFCRDLEMACDERILASFDTETRKRYAHALLQYSSAPGSNYASPLYFSMTKLRGRIANVLRMPAVSAGSKVLFGSILCALCVFFFTSAAPFGELSAEPASLPPQCAVSLTGPPGVRIEEIGSAETADALLGGFDWTSDQRLFGLTHRSAGLPPSALPSGQADGTPDGNTLPEGSYRFCFDCVPTVFFISYRTESGTAYQNEGLTYFDGVLTVPPDCRAVRLHALWQLPTYENSADYYFFIR